MEKLIELLNEYEIWKWENGLDIRQQYAEHNFKYNKWLYSIVISKKYEFIKRLVENDKIDFYTILKENWTFRKEFYAIENKKEYERLIMLLSVEDNSIEFLIDLLK